MGHMVYYHYSREGNMGVGHDHRFRQVCVVGLGYVGLPTSLLLCSAGISVHGYDVSPLLVETLNQGVVTIKEPGLQELLSQAQEFHLFTVDTKPKEADAYLIAVPTPIKDDKTAELSYVQSASRDLVPLLKAGDLVVLESTVPPHCTRDVVGKILEETGLKAGQDFYLAHCPERVLPGNAVNELRNNTRTIGGATPECARAAKEFYQSFVSGEVITTGLLEAEISKLAENAFRDANLAFVNSLAAMCERAGINVQDVIELANHHPRVNLLQPGPGVGGHCIPVDPWFLIEAFPNDAQFLKQARLVNDDRPRQVVESVLRLAQQHQIEDPVVTVLGVTYKANVCDVRESPALVAVQELQRRGVRVRVCDPIANGSCPIPTLSVEEAVHKTDIVLALVAHDVFRPLTVETLREYHGQRAPLVFDACGLWPAEARTIERELNLCDVAAGA